MIWIQAHPIATTFIGLGAIALVWLIIRSGGAGALLDGIGDIID